MPETEGGQCWQLPSRVRGHLTADGVELTRARMHACQEKAGSVSHQPLVALSKPASNLLFFFRLSFLFQVIMHNQQRISTTL